MLTGSTLDILSHPPLGNQKMRLSSQTIYYYMCYWMMDSGDDVIPHFLIHAGLCVLKVKVLQLQVILNFFGL